MTNKWAKIWTHFGWSYGWNHWWSLESSQLFLTKTWNKTWLESYFTTICVNWVNILGANRVSETSVRSVTISDSDSEQRRASLRARALSHCTPIESTPLTTAGSARQQSSTAVLSLSLSLQSLHSLAVLLATDCFKCCELCSLLYWQLITDLISTQMCHTLSTTTHYWDKAYILVISMHSILWNELWNVWDSICQNSIEWNRMKTFYTNYQFVQKKDPFHCWSRNRLRYGKSKMNDLKPRMWRSFK